MEALLCLLYLALQAYQMLERTYRQHTPAAAPQAERQTTAEQLLRAFAVTGIIAEQGSVGQLLQPTRLSRRDHAAALRTGKDPGIAAYRP